MDKQYLGDGVYAEMENSMVKLTTSDGIIDTNTIYLELEVWQALVRICREDRAIRNGGTMNTWPTGDAQALD